MPLDRAVVIERLGQMAQDSFDRREFFCSEAVLHFINMGFGQPAPPEIVKMATGFAEGMGSSGCTCGALSGGVMALGLLFGREKVGGLSWRKSMKLSRKLHNGFKERHGSTCCRVLTKKARNASESKYGQCARFTKETTEFVASLILDTEPKLLEKVDKDFLGL